MKEALLNGNIKTFASLLNKSWVDKKKTARAITNSFIEEIYETAINAGALAGKVSGAGGGGYMFGEKVASLVDGLTKLTGTFDSRQAVNFRKMLLTLSDDVRVILIKLADRLHNMRTLDSMPPNKQLKITSETIYIFAPLAHRLGLYAIKTELEDLSLKYKYPEVYNQIEMKLHGAEEQINYLVYDFARPIQEKLHEIYRIQNGCSHFYSFCRTGPVAND